MKLPRGVAPRFPLRLDRVGAATNDGAQPASTLLRPQAHLRQAAADAARRVVPSGLGLDSAAIRRRMVERLRATGVLEASVLEAMAGVPRHLFVDSALVNQAYEDTSLPIGHGQTISKPSVVARMIELLAQGQSARAAGSLGRVLEIGTGCGYQAAVLSRMARQVLSIERIRPLHERARVHLALLGETRVRLVYGDGMVGHAPGAPFDSIIAAAGGDALPQPWIDQLGPGGRLVAPVRTQGTQQILVVLERTDDGFRRSVHEMVHFVPLQAGVV